MYVPGLVGELSLPKDTGMVRTTLPSMATDTCLVLSSPVATSARPMVKSSVLFCWPNTPSPRSMPYVFTSTWTLVPGFQKFCGRQRSSLSLSQ